MMKPVNYNALVAQMMGLVGPQNSLMPVAMKNNPLNKSLNPIAGTEGGSRAGTGGGARAMPRYTREQLERWDIDKLDRLAWGHKQGDRLSLSPSQVNIRFKDDLVNPQARFDAGGMPWARSVNQSEPVQIAVGRDGKFYLLDGHHRWFAAQKTGQPLNAEIVKIEGNSINKILGE